MTGLAQAANVGHEAVFRQLCASLHDESYDVRAAAASALSDLGDARASTQLSARWDLETDPVVLAALEAALARVD